MTTLEVRRPKFDFTGDVPWDWNPANPQFSFFMNATSLIAICFEQMIVAAVQEAKPLLADPAVAAEATAFLRQEAQHSSTHRKHVAALIRRYPGLQHTLDAAIDSFDEVTRTATLKFRLAYIADLEATFTPTFKMMLDHEATLFRPGDDRVASLLMWHFVEEVEHRSSALTIYDAAIGDSWYRMRALPGVFRHLMAVAALIADGVNEHVPERDRKVDARTFLPTYRLRQALRRQVPTNIPSAFSTVPRRERLLAAGRVLLSQTPFHDPADQPLPEFADRWLERWNSGEDVTHWYTSQPLR